MKARATVTRVDQQVVDISTFELAHLLSQTFTDKYTGLDPAVDKIDVGGRILRYDGRNSHTGEREYIASRAASAEEVETLRALRIVLDRLFYDAPRG